MDEIIKILKKMTGLKEIKLETPPDLKLGDYAFPCFQLGKNPNEAAKELQKKIPIKGMIAETRVIGPYLNFFIDKKKQAEETIKRILKEKETKKTKKKILIEFPSPNTNKPLHLGHVRNIALGTSLTNLNKAIGHDVYRVNINNDRGIHICKSMLAYKLWGKGDTPEKSGMKSDFFVGKYYVMFNKKAEENPELEKQALEMLEKWEKGDKETRELWKKMNKWALEGFEETYKKFGVKFEQEDYESETYEEGKKIVLEGLKKGLFKKREDGAIHVKLEKYGEKVLLRANKTTVYITQDLYLAVKRWKETKFDKLYYVVASEQKYHFEVLFELFKKLGYEFADKVEHYSYGMVNLTTGRMKSREGTVIDADDLVKGMEDMAKEETKKRHSELSEKELEKRAATIAMAAIKFYLLKYEPMKDITFEPKESISFEGETGPYCQYAYARISSILKKAEPKGKANYNLLETEQEKNLIMHLSKNQETIKEAAEKGKPHLIARYCLELAQKFNEFYHNCLIIQEDKEKEKTRTELIKAVKKVMKQGLGLMGIGVLEEM